MKIWPFKRDKRSFANPQQFIVDYFQTGLKSATGRNINADAALQASAVYACVRFLSETIASLPLHIYKKLEGGGKERATDHYLYDILHHDANPEMNSFEFRELIMVHLCLRGNAYIEMVRDNGGRVRELWPLNPDRVTVERDKITKQIAYTILLDNGRSVKIGSDRIFHIRGMSGDGLIGYSPVRYMREAIGLSLATEEYGARFFGNNANPGGVLEHPGKIGDEAQKRLKKSWNDIHEGLENAHKVAILEEGLKFHQIGIAPEDAQFLATRKFQLNEIARMFNVRPHMIGDLERSTNNNIEHQGIENVVYTIRPWAIRIEQAIKHRLLGKEDNQYFAEFLVDGLLRGDIASRYSAYATGRNGGWLSADDIRELENQNPLPNGEGKIYLTPLNMIPAGTPQPQEPMSQTPIDINRAFNAMAQDAMQRIVRREKADVMRAIKRYLIKNDLSIFSDWLEDFYKEHKDFISRNLLPVLKAFAGENQNINITEYLDKHIQFSKSEILDIVNSEEEVEDKLNNLFMGWENSRNTEGLLRST